MEDQTNMVDGGSVALGHNYSKYLIIRPGYNTTNENPRTVRRPDIIDTV